MNTTIQTRNNLRPMPLWESTLFFGIPAIVNILTIWYLMPSLMARGLTEFVSESIAFSIPPLFILVGALLAYRMEGYPLNWAALKARFRLRRLTGKDWLWAFGLLAFVAVAGLVLAPIILSPVFDGIENGVIPLPDFVPSAIDPRVVVTPDTLEASFGGPPEGNWSLVVILAAVATLGVIGEEFMWRGYVLPRQELAHGNYAWVIHGVQWTLFHAFKYWALPGMLPIALAYSLVSQRRKNTMPAIIVHGVEKIFGLIGILLLVLGM